MQERNCDFVIGIGGGSPIDAAKAISLAARNQFTRKDLFQPDIAKQAVPIVAIPTTSGTGTEVTPYSVLTDSEKEKKAGFGTALIFPRFSFLDPAYTLSLPLSATRDTALDALSHLLEGLYSKKRNDLLFPLIYSGISLIYKYLPLCLENPQKEMYRENLMLASLYGGMVIAQSGTTLQHSIGYPLTSVYGLSHGSANGIVMKSIMQLYSSAIKPELDQLFLHLGISKQDFFAWLDQFEFHLSSPISSDFLQKRIPEVMNSRNMALNPIKVSEEQIRQIYLDL